MRELCRLRPEVDLTLDQAHATPETAVRRALYMYDHDALEGRDVLVLGDDDLTSLAIGLLSDFLRLKVGGVVVLEVDHRLVSYISQIAPQVRQHMEIIEHDVRRPLPTTLTRAFDVFITDPPYTLPGLGLFVSRGVEALRRETGKQGYVCFGRRTPDETAAVVGALLDMGLAPVEIIPDFNRYLGAQVLGGVSQMIRTVSTGNTRPRIVGAHSGSLYTNDGPRGGGDGVG